MCKCSEHRDGGYGGRTRLAHIFSDTIGLHGVTDHALQPGRVGRRGFAHHRTASVREGERRATYAYI